MVTRVVLSLGFKAVGVDPVIALAISNKRIRGGVLNFIFEMSSNFTVPKLIFLGLSAP